MMRQCVKGQHVSWPRACRRLHHLLARVHAARAAQLEVAGSTGKPSRQGLGAAPERSGLCPPPLEFAFVREHCLRTWAGAPCCRQRLHTPMSVLASPSEVSAQTACTWFTHCAASRCSPQRRALARRSLHALFDFLDSAPRGWKRRSSGASRLPAPQAADLPIHPHSPCAPRPKSDYRGILRVDVRQEGPTATLQQRREARRTLAGPKKGR